MNGGGGGTYAYGAIRSADARPVRERGVLGGEVRFVERDGLAVIASDVEGAVPARRADLLAHLAVLEELAGEATVLPMRFGTVFDTDDEAVLELLVRRRDVLDRLFEDLEGTVELSVKAIYDEDAVMGEIVAERPDIARLSRRTRGLPEDATYFERIRLGELVAQALQRKREADGEAVIRRLTPFALDVVVGAPTMERMLVSASFLVRRERVDEFARAVGDLERDHGERMRFRLTGPLPPYSFVSLEDDPVTAGSS
jgi:Gas vesicle synthesis protein GvpL/GvpF